MVETINNRDINKMSSENERLREALIQCLDYIKNRHNMGRNIREGKRLILMTQCNMLLNRNKDSGDMTKTP